MIRSTKLLTSTLCIRNGQTHGGRVIARILEKGSCINTELFMVAIRNRGTTLPKKTNVILDAPWVFDVQSTKTARKTTGTPGSGSDVRGLFSSLVQLLRPFGSGGF